MNTKLIARIRAARESAGMTQADLAKRIGTTQQMVYRYESGQQEPTVSRLIEIAKALNVRPAKLLEDETMENANVTIWEENGVRYMSDDQDTVELAEDITADQVYWSDIDGYVHADGTPIKTK